MPKNVRPCGIVTLTTDFGRVDSYVPEVKAVLLSAQSSLNLVDLSHDIPPGDVRAAAYLLRNSAFRFPPGTVHLAIVDPGVGTSRHALACRVKDQFFILPDNGLITLVANPLPVFASIIPPPLDSDSSVSPTFHGRDLFAPAAARLASGAYELQDIGPRLRKPVEELWPTHSSTASEVTGEIAHVDRFGNLVTNIPSHAISSLPKATLTIQEHLVATRVRTYGDAKAGTLVWLTGSTGHVEISLVEGSASLELSLGRGARVRLSAVPE